jgi:hypothetical protein
MRSNAVVSDKRIIASPRKLIILNGPPRSGKDTAAHAIWRTVENSKIIRMSAPLKDGLRTIFDMTDDEAAWLEENKEKPSAVLNGHSWREAQIMLSETHLKTTYGRDVFGRIFTRKLQRCASDVVINSDAGFEYEWAEPLRLVKPINALLIKIHRPGHNYEADSRNYIELPNVRTVWVHNTGEKRTFEDNVLQVVTAWLSL